MNYLKKFESFQTHDEIHEICKKYNITSYTINSDGSIDVDDDVNLTHKIFEKLPLKFNHVSGNFDCSCNYLTTLEGVPKSVGGDFYCEYNKLTTLKYAPQSVNGNFDCHENELTSLEDAPQSVGGDFDCRFNKLTTLKYAPQSVGGDFYCSLNKLNTLEGAPQSVKGDFDCNFNELTTLKGGPQSAVGGFDCSYNYLTTLEDSPQSVDGDFDCSYNYLTTLKGAPQSVYSFGCSYNKDLKSLDYLSKYISEEKVIFRNTAVYEIFKLLDSFSLGMIRLVNNVKVIVDDKVDIEKLNDLLYDQGKSPVENVKGYDNI